MAAAAARAAGGGAAAPARAARLRARAAGKGFGGAGGGGKAPSKGGGGARKKGRRGGRGGGGSDARRIEEPEKPMELRVPTVDTAPGVGAEYKEAVVVDMPMDVGDAVDADFNVQRGKDAVVGRGDANAGVGDAAFEARLKALEEQTGGGSAAPTAAQAQAARPAGTPVFDTPNADARAAEAEAGAEGVRALAAALAFVFVAATGLYSLSDLGSGAFSRDVAGEQVQAQAQQLSAADRKQLLAQVAAFEGRVAADAADTEALEGLAVSFAELGQLDRAEDALVKLTEMREGDREALRLLGEVRFNRGDAAGAARAYVAAADASVLDDIDVLQGLTDAYIADGKPGEAVAQLLKAKKTSTERRRSAEESAAAAGLFEGVDGTVLLTGADLTQLDLLLGKAYAAWNKPGDALVLFEGLIKERPKDWRGYLAKGGLLRDLGKSSDAEKAFFLAKAAARASGDSTAEAVVDRVMAAR